MSAQFILSLSLALAPSAGPPANLPWILQYGLTGDQVTSRSATLRTSGYQPVCVSGYNVGESNRFVVVWEKVKGTNWVLDYGLTPAQLDRRAADLKDRGFRPVALSGYDLGISQGFIDLWRKSTGPDWQVQYGLSSADLARQAANMKDNGYRPRTVSSYVSGTFSRYALIWEKGGDVAWELKWGLSAASLEDALTSMSESGYRPLALAGMGVEEQITYSAVWIKSKGTPWVARYGLDGDGLTTLAGAMSAKGYVPIHVSGYPTLNGVRFTSVWQKPTSP